MFSEVHTFTVLAQGGSTPVPIYFGAAHISSANVGTHLGDNFNAVSDFTSGVGAFNNYASINAKWADTTDFDNIRADGTGAAEGDYSDSKSWGNTIHTNSTNNTTY